MKLIFMVGSSLLCKEIYNWKKYKLPLASFCEFVSGAMVFGYDPIVKNFYSGRLIDRDSNVLEAIKKSNHISFQRKRKF